MNRLTGPHITINTPELRKLIGKRVQYRTDGMWQFTATSIVEDVIRRQVLLGGEYIPFNRIREMVLIEETTLIE